MSTKIHAAVDALGNPVRLILTAGQVSAYTQAEQLIKGLTAKYVLADKGDDFDQFVSAIIAPLAESVIPAKKNRKQPREHDKALYKERNLVERFFQKLKNFRRIATRYERLATTYQAMLNLGAIMIWLNRERSLEFISKYLKFTKP